MSDRDDLAELLYDADRDAVITHLAAEHLADAIIAAGWRREQSAPETATPGESISPKWDGGTWP